WPADAEGDSRWLGNGDALRARRHEDGRAQNAGHRDTRTLLRTPTAQLAVNGGSQHPDKRRDGGHGPTLADEVEHLLPTPRASDGDKGGPNQRGSSGDLMLPSAVVQLLPTPVVNDMGKAYTPDEWDAWTARLKAEHGNGNGHGPSLEIEAARLAEPELLPTPMTAYTATTAEQWRARRPAGNGGVRERVGDLRIVTEELLGEGSPAVESNKVDDG